MLSNIKIGHRLGIGFAIIILFSGVTGSVAIHGMNKLTELTSTMYSEPFLVTNTLYEMQNNATTLHQSMADYILEEAPNSQNKLINQALAEQHKINSGFHTLKKHFPEKINEIENMRNIFNAWEENRKKIIQLNSANDFDQAGALVHIEDANRLNEVKQIIRQLVAFEKLKANRLLVEAETSKNAILFEMYVLLSLILLVGVFISLYISRSITTPINTIVSYIKPLAQGDLSPEIKLYSKDEIGLLADSFRELAKNLKHKAHIADKITRGELDQLIESPNKSDQLSNVMNKMILSLRQSIKEDDKRLWLNNGISSLNQLMQGEQSITQLSQIIINHLCGYLNSLMGAIYIFNTIKNVLEFRAGYAFAHSSKITKDFSLGEGFIGQTALNNKIFQLNDIPSDYTKMQSSIGSTLPNKLVFTPIYFETQLIAVMEMAFIENTDNSAKELLEIVREDIGIALNSAKSRNKISKLLLDSERQSEELQQQQSALQKTNEELEEQTNNLLESERLLKEQQGELKKNNAQLEEMTESLETQKDNVEKKNIALQSAGEEIELKINELEISSQYKSEFLANMSHELRTPLNSLLLLSRMLKDNSEGNLTEEQVKSAAIIYNSGNDLLDLINDILDLSKIEAGQMDVHYENIQISTLTDVIATTFNHLFKAKKLSFSIHIDTDVPKSFFSDVKRIDQIIKNLLSNALKFTQKGGVTLSIEIQKPTFNDALPFISISITDTGIGIAPGKLHIIFEEFKQADGGISRNFGGTGLGLSISRKLAELLGGSIKLQSQLNIGSTFSLILPLRKEAPKNQAPRAIEASPFTSAIHPLDSVLLNNQDDLGNISPNIFDDHENININDDVLLIIEDDENFSITLVKQARENGFKALVADNGKYGLKLASEFKPNAILLDIKLPDISGFEVLDTLKNNTPTRHIPVHVMSISEVEHQVSQKGAIGFLQKPVTEDNLKSAFQQLSLVAEKKVKDLLLVENDKNAQESIKTLIGNSDVVITMVTTGADAEKEIIKKQYDCVVLDLGLSDISGFELLERLQKNRQITIPPIIIYTGKELSQTEVNQLREYSQSIIIKGIKSEDRLLDETALFLHRIIGNLPKKKQKMIMDLHDKDAMFRDKIILVVDDDMRNVFALSQLLYEKGFKVIKAEDGEKGLEKLAANPEIAIVLMDVMMPKMDGLEAIKQIRSQKQHHDLPIIALTAKAMKEDRDNCIAAGANDYLSKPIDVSRLFSMLRVWLSS